MDVWWDEWPCCDDTDCCRGRQTIQRKWIPDPVEISRSMLTSPISRTWRRCGVDLAWIWRGRSAGLLKIEPGFAAAAVLAEPVSPVVEGGEAALFATGQSDYRMMLAAVLAGHRTTTVSRCWLDVASRASRFEIDDCAHSVPLHQGRTIRVGWGCHPPGGGDLIWRTTGALDPQVCCCGGAWRARSTRRSSFVYACPFRCMIPGAGLLG